MGGREEKRGPSGCLAEPSQGDGFKTCLWQAALIPRAFMLEGIVERHGGVHTRAPGGGGGAGVETQILR